MVDLAERVVYEIQFQRGTAARWTLKNPILKAGEPGYETDTDGFKVGDGMRRWSDIPYVSDPGAIADLRDKFGQLSDLQTENKDSLVAAVNEVNSLLQFSVPLRTLYNNAKAG